MARYENAKIVEESEVNEGKVKTPPKYCYANTLSKFMQVTKELWMESMQDNIKAICNEPASESQIESWDDCFDVLKKELAMYAAANPDVYIIFEYVLRYTSRKRPDVILLSKDQLIILEFKRKNSPLLDDRAQTEEYARNLYLYHGGSSKMKSITPMLVLTYTDVIETHKEGIAYIVSKGHLAEAVEKFMINPEPMENINGWIEASYRNLPSIIEAAKAKKDKIELPEYEIVRKAGISDAEKCLEAHVRAAQREKKYVLALVNGVPGAGKTLLGIDLAYGTYNTELNINSAYMSGNGPLVAVLQDALDSDTFVKNIHVYLDQYTDDGAEDFNYNVCIFDEGQRTWTAQQRAKKGKKRPEMSEASLMVELIDKRVDWCFLLVLVGTGQEINAGEENGLQLWKDAIKKSRHKWEVLCPPSLDDQYADCKIIEDELREKLSLVNSLRSNCSTMLSSAMNCLIAGQVDEARRLYAHCKKLYPIYITKNLNKAKEFCKEHYKDDETKKYGFIASSQELILPDYGVDNSYNSTKQTRTFPARWYNAPVDSNLSCCAFSKTVTEFGCQGLEIDMPIVCWEGDFIWNGTSWDTYNAWQRNRNRATGIKREYRLNTYRVLLTRGRDGMIIFVPPVNDLDITYNMLVSIGFEEI